MLYSKIEQKEFESKSQGWKLKRLLVSSCIQRSNKKNLKANHNWHWQQLLKTNVVFKDRTKRIWKQITTKILTYWHSDKLYSKIEQKEFESKSQRLFASSLMCASCIQRSNKKNLKANHNGWKHYDTQRIVVFKDRTKRIWKQITTTFGIPFIQFGLYSKIEQKEFESKSQPVT